MATAHEVSIETKPKTGRRRDPPRLWWYCTCGAGDPVLVTPAEANAAADRHLANVAMTGPFRVGLVSCAGQKVNAPSAPAAALYRSPMFRKSLRHALATCSKVYILSARHGLVELDQVVETYDQRMARTKTERAAWGAGVAQSLLDRHAGDRHRMVLYILAGHEYAAPIVRATETWWPNWRAHIVEPLAQRVVSEAA